MISVGIFLLSFVFFLHGVAPTLYGGDSGELAVAASVLGIPHAPGYPTYTILANFFQSLLPFGNAVYQINVFSSLVASSVLVLLFRVLKGLFNSKASLIPASLGTVLLCFSPIFVEQARAAEVFGLNLLFILGIGLGLLPFFHSKNIKKRIRWFFLSFFLFGVGLGNHHTLLTVLPLFMVGLWTMKPSLRLKVGLQGVLFLLLGLTIYGVLPIRALVNPPVNFGDPETISRFWKVFTRHEFGSLSLHPAALPFRNFSIMIDQTIQFLLRGIAQIGFVGMGWGLLGLLMGHLDKEVRKFQWIPLWLIFVCGLGFELLSNMSPGSAIAQWRLERFSLIPLLGYLILIGQSVLKGLGHRRWRILVVLFFLGWVGERSVTQPLKSFRSNFIFHDFSNSILRLTPRYSSVIIDRVLFDEPTSALLVSQTLFKKRDDINFYYRPGTLFNAAYGEDILDLSWPSRIQRQAKIEIKLLKREGEDVRCLAFDKNNVPFSDARLDGYLYTFKKSNGGESALHKIRLFSLNRSRHNKELIDYPSRLMAVHFPYFFGKNAQEAENIKKASQWFNKATTIGGDMAWLWSNLGGLWVHGEENLKARRAFQNAVKLDPYFYEGHYGMGYVSIKENNFDQAIQHYKRATELKPMEAEAHYMLGVAYTLAGRVNDANDSWKKYLRISPRGEQASDVKKRLQRLSS